MSNGYANIQRNGKKELVSRIVCGAVNGPAPTPKHEAAHSCGMGHKGCISPKHLRWATRKENEDDKFLHGTRQHSKTPKPRRRRNKLTLDDVREIIILSRTLTQYELARKFNVHQSSISHIITRATWRNA
jgi:hypothetical protein